MLVQKSGPCNVIIQTINLVSPFFRGRREVHIVMCTIMISNNGMETMQQYGLPNKRLLTFFFHSHSTVTGTGHWTVISNLFHFQIFLKLNSYSIHVGLTLEEQYEQSGLGHS